MTDLGQVSMSLNPRPLKQVGHVSRFISDILCYLDYLKSKFLYKICVFNKDKSYLIKINIKGLVNLYKINIKVKCQGFFKK